MISRRELLATGAAATVATGATLPAFADNAPGVTATEIRIGQTMPYSGPASAYGIIGRTEVAYFKMINAQGGINGRKINLMSLDDGYSPPKAVEDIRRLVEQEKVAFIFQSLGTPSNSAIMKYLNNAKIPQLFVATGAAISVIRSIFLGQWALTRITRLKLRSTPSTSLPIIPRPK